ncbi:MAG: CpsD/CapB family tyrosine-protein kinase [Actinomycetota bacterium]|nr:CpsD/CapB family tyrosine-protein kinase [Acidimicrobiia bacterium]MDQ3293506.1 CpsD/CapB family tyrosine-protein kinase [Actinomycetota bacterium]
MRKRNRPPATRIGSADVETDEAFRVLRSNLLVTLSDLANPIVVITSAQAGEGKTSTCAGLATALASTGRRVVVVDFDLRRPDLHKHLDAANDVGVSSFLLGERPLAECLQYVSLPPAPGGADAGLYLLAAGPLVASPAELLSSVRIKRLLDALAAQADVVLIDSPPVLPIVDTLEICRRAAGAILVVEVRRTEIGAAQRAKDALIQNQTRLLGVIVNKVPRSELSYGYGDAAVVEVAPSANGSEAGGS